MGGTYKSAFVAPAYTFSAFGTKALHTRRLEHASLRKVAPSKRRTNRIRPTATQKNPEQRLASANADRDAATGAQQRSHVTDTDISDRVRSFLSRAKEGNPLEGLRRADAAYARLRSGEPSKPVDMVHEHATAAPQTSPDSKRETYDVLVAGGTLGVFVALSLQLRGLRCAIVERGRVVGRTQEWNISRQELATLLDMNLLTAAELEEAIVSEWNPSRISFATSRTEPPRELLVDDILNCGVRPEVLVRCARDRFESLGGICVEYATVKSVDVYTDCVVASYSTPDSVNRPSNLASLGAGGTGVAADDDVVSYELESLAARLLVDAMGSFSPISAQARNGQRPDGVCVTVGACCEGPFPSNDFGDLICAIDPIDASRSTQYFWEAFPASPRSDAEAEELRTTGQALRTTYMFAYGSCDPARPSLADTLDDYLAALPRYQNIESVDDLKPHRVLFGFFPAWKASPLEPTFDRVFAVGDAGGLQSPISFGGFGCICRHLPRITNALTDALAEQNDALLDKRSLKAAAPYLPALSVTWLFNKFMSCKPGEKRVALMDEYGINQVLMLNMECMAQLGDSVQRPFLQDVVQPRALLATLFAMMTSQPLLAVRLLPHIGAADMLEWLRHFAALFAYDVLYSPDPKRSKPISPSSTQVSIGPAEFASRRKQEALEYGSGRDH